MGKELIITLAGAVIILLLAQFINSAMEVASFEETYKEALISNYEILGRSTKDRIQGDLINGKPLYLNNRLTQYARQLLSQDSYIADMMVTGTDQEIIFHTTQSLQGKVIADTALFPTLEETPPGESVLTELKQRYYLGFPLINAEGSLEGGFYLSFDKTIVQEKINQVIRTHTRYFLAILTMAVLIMTLLLLVSNTLCLRKNKSARFRRAIFTAIIVSSVVISQLLFAFINQTYFRDTYRTLFMGNARTLADDISSEFEEILTWDIPLDRLAQAENYLGERLGDSNEASEIYITDDSGNVFFFARKTQTAKEQTIQIAGKGGANAFFLPQQALKLEPREGEILSPLMGASPQSSGFLLVKINQQAIENNLREMFLDTLTIILVSFIFSLELLRLLTLFVGKDSTDMVMETQRIKLNRIRLTAFLFFFAALIPLSFLPIFIEKIYTLNPIELGLWKGESLLSLPISSYMIGITIFIPIVGTLSQRLSQKTIFLISGLLFVAGTVWTALSGTMVELIVARFIAGLGYGGGIINSTTLIIKSTTVGNRSQGFGNWSAGFAAASICAISIGGVVVFRLGYTVAFLMSAVFGILTILFIYLQPQEKNEEEKITVENIGNEKARFFNNKENVFKDYSVLSFYGY